MVRSKRLRNLEDSVAMAQQAVDRYKSKTLSQLEIILGCDADKLQKTWEDTLIKRKQELTNYKENKAK